MVSREFGDWFHSTGGSLLVGWVPRYSPRWGLVAEAIPI